MTHRRPRPRSRKVLGALAALLAWTPALAAPPAPRPPATLTVAAGGDVILGRFRGGRWRATADLARLAAAAPGLRAADLALVNLETPLVADLARCVDHGDRFRFRAPPSFAATLAEAGVDVASVANNHALDCGEPGLLETVAALRTAGVAPAGLPAPVVVRAGDAKVAVVAASDRRSRAPAPPGRLALHRPERLADAALASVRALRARRGAEAVDVIVVSLHTGVEHALTPQPATVRLARALVDAGADLVLCHHTHTAQPVELYGGGAIAYGLGELLFDAAPSAKRHAALFTFTLARTASGRYRVDGVAVTAIGPSPAKVSAAFLAGLAERSARRGVAFEGSAAGLRWRR